MPPDLARLQDGFRLNALAATAPSGADPSPPAELLAVVNAAGAPAERRLRIHRNHFAATLVDALAGVFAATRALVGEDYFASFALRLARARPPASPCLFEYGADLPQALAEAPGLEAHGYVVDVARLEWAMHASFHAPAADVLAPARLAAIPADRVAGVRLRPLPSLRLVEAPFPVDDLWRQARAGAVDPATLGGDATWLVLRRPDLDVVMERATPATYALLDALRQGHALGDAAAAAAARVADFDFTAALGDCLSLGVLTDHIEQPV